MMKINFILPGLGDSGGIKVVMKYASLLNGQGIDTVVYCPMLAYNLHRYSSHVKNRIHQLYCTVKTIAEKNSKKKVVWIPYVSDKYIREADHTIATMWATAYDVDKLSSRCGKKWYFVQGFEIWDNKELGLQSYQLPLHKIVISTWINEQLHNALGIGPFPVVYNGIDREVFNSANRTSHEGITFLMLNHTMEKKGVKQGLEVFKKIHAKYPQTSLRMFGMCSRENLPSEIEYFQNPSQEELVRLYRDTDVFIFPSLEEGWGLTPIEAMACGCVITGSRTGFILDLGKDGNNVIVSEPGDVDGMYKQLNELIPNKEKILQLQSSGLQTVMTLDWDYSIDKLIKVLMYSGDRYL